MATNFDKAFAAARKGGKKEFSFGGKQYNTKLKGEGGKAKKSSLPKKGPVPEKRPLSKPVNATAGASKPVEAKAKVAVNARKAERADYPKPAGDVGIARKGSAISKAKAARDNAPVPKKTKGLFLLGPRTKAYKDR